MTDNTWPAEFIVNGECVINVRLTPEQLKVILDVLKTCKKINGGQDDDR